MMSTNNVVLVVDDSLDSIHMLNDVLEDAKFSVLVALEGSQALAITQNIHPDIILLDAIMPNMDGFETCKRLKQNPQLADVPIIFMTGLSDTEHIVRGLGAGGVDYITKPINAHELVARMRVHLTNARITHSARTALDSAGQYLLTLNKTGQLLWATPQVYELLKSAGALESGNQLSPDICNSLRNWFDHNPDVGRKLIPAGNLNIFALEVLSLMDGKEYLLRLTRSHEPQQDTHALKEHFAVTGREADVLFWITNGKTNREIGQILDMSPRTVNKHLEQIFRKLGVENRTSAAAAALKCLSKA